MPRSFRGYGFDRWKLEGHRDRSLEEKKATFKGRMGQHEYGWTILSLAQVAELQEAAALFHPFENVRQEVWEFNVDHWSFLGKAIPDAVAKWIGRRWGWHRMIYGQKPLALLESGDKPIAAGPTLPTRRPFRVTYRMTKKTGSLGGLALLSGYCGQRCEE